MALDEPVGLTHLVLMFFQLAQNFCAVATADPVEQLIADNAASHRRQHHADKVEQPFMSRHAAQQRKGFPFGDTADQQRQIAILRN